MSTSPQTSQIPSGGTSCNGMSIAFAIATLVFGAVGYRYAIPHGMIAGIGGAIGGIVVGFVVTPLAFLLLMVLIHVTVKTEDWLRTPRG